MPEARIALLTGSRTGLGRHLAERLLRAGFVVHGCSRGASDLAAEGYHHRQLDVTDEGAVRSWLAAVREAHGGVDVLVNAAGVAVMNHALLTPLETARRILDVNVVGTFLLCREAAKLMRGREAPRIVNFSSVAVPLQLEGESIYAASKAAVETLTRILARELAPFGITVNAVAPGPVATDLLRHVPGAALDALLARQAIHRLGQPADVANVVEFFLREESGLVTGQVVYLGGP